MSSYFSSILHYGSMTIASIWSLYWTWIMIKTYYRTYKHEKGKLKLFKMFLMNIFLWISVLVYFSYSMI